MEPRSPAGVAPHPWTFTCPPTLGCDAKPPTRPFAGWVGFVVGFHGSPEVQLRRSRAQPRFTLSRLTGKAK